MDWLREILIRVLRRGCSTRPRCSYNSYAKRIISEVDIESRDIITGLLTWLAAKPSNHISENTRQGIVEGLCFGTAGDLGGM